MNRRKQRELVFLLLFENIFNEYSFEDIKEIKLLIKSFSEENFDGFVQEYFKDIMNKKEDIDNVITKFSFKWGKERLSKVSLAILRLAVYEIIYKSEIPTSVAINEAVELSKKYGTDKESAFINGLLGGVSRSLEKKNE